MRIFIISILSIIFGWSHPVSYSIDLKVDYNEVKKELKVLCQSDSRNKCGLHNFHLLDMKDRIIKTARFPFLKKSITISMEDKPSKMVFFLRKIPEHTYLVYIE